jgi:GNAT superfamily N-acetyltransferase
MSDHTPTPKPISSKPDTVIPLAKDQEKRFREVMSRAFFNDPIFLYAVPDEMKRLKKIGWFFQFLTRYGARYGEMFTTPAVDGGTIWIKPGNTSFTLGQMLYTGFLKMPFVFGWNGFTRFMRFSDLVDKWHEQCVDKAHWYLAAVGVDPSRQGQGIGSALLQPMLARADSDGLPCYLETLAERNLPLYERHGFHVAASGEIPGGGPMAWAMVRPPQ